VINIPTEVIGALVGFALAQSGNFVAFLREQWMGPKLKIEAIPVILDHSAEVGQAELVRETIYEITVSNRGRRVAKSVTVALARATYFGADREVVLINSLRYLKEGISCNKNNDIIPKTALNFEVARWREDENFFFPAGGRLAEYFEESASGFRKVEFLIVAWDVEGRHRRLQFTVDRDQPLAKG